VSLSFSFFMLCPIMYSDQGLSLSYLTAKVIETNSSSIALGMSVAPVTDWR